MPIKYSERKCEMCDKLFQPTKSWQRFCCQAHAISTYNKTHDIAGMLKKIRNTRKAQKQEQSSQ